MTTQQTQIVALKDYLKERLGEWKQLPEGPWSEEALSVVDSDRLDILNCVREHTSIYQDRNLASCIAHARTDSPILLANTLREVEFLEEKLQLTPAAFPASGDWNEGYNALLSAMKKSMEIRLDEILELFKEVLG